MLATQTNLYLRRVNPQFHFVKREATNIGGRFVKRHAGLPMPILCHVECANNKFDVADATIPNAMWKLQHFLPVCIVILSGCGSDRSVATPLHPCPALSLNEPLVYPANGSNDSIDDPKIVIVANFLGQTLYLHSSSGATVSSSTIVDIPSPLPTPNTAVDAAGLPLTAFTIPALAGATTYTVSSAANDPCGTIHSGSFTTK